MIFDVVLLTFAIEIKHHAEFESCLRNHENTVIVIPQLRCFQLNPPFWVGEIIFDDEILPPVG